MTDKTKNTILIFCCYAREDKALYDQLKMHLAPLQHQGFIDVWSDHDIDAGTEWMQEIEKRVNEADIALLLISPDFMASKYHSPHVRHAIQGTRRSDPEQVGENTNFALSIPILLRPTSWEDTSLAQLDMLPRNHIPVTEFEDWDEAFCDIAKELRYKVENSLINVWQDEANALYRAGKYNEALAVYEKLLQLKSSLAASVCKGITLNNLYRYEEALRAYEQARHSKRSSLRNQAPNEKRTTDGDKFYEEALQIYEQIFQRSLPSSSHSPWPGMTLTDVPLLSSGVDQSVIDRLNQAIQHNPINPFLYHLKGNVFFRLDQFREALGAYEQAIEMQEEGFELSQRYLSEAIQKLSQQEYQKLNTLARRDLEKANQIRDKRGR